MKDWNEVKRASTDQILAWAEAQPWAKAMADCQRAFAFNGTNTVRQTRKRWIDLFVDYGARVELVYVEPPLPVVFQQNERRTNPVPKKVIQHLVDKLEPPTWAEAHSVRLVG